MASKVYECMVLFDPNRYARDPGGVSAKLTTIVEKVGGEMLASRLWMEQKLAYPINGHRKGVYWLTYFNIDGEKITELNRELQLVDEVMRFLVIHIDPRLAGTMVAMARGEAIEEPAAEENSDEDATESEAVETAAAE